MQRLTSQRGALGGTGSDADVDNEGSARYPQNVRGTPFETPPAPAEDPASGSRKPRHLRMYGGRGYTGKGSTEENAQDQMGARGPQAEGGARAATPRDTAPAVAGQGASPAAATGQGMWKALWNRIAARREARGATSQSVSAAPVGRPVRLNPPKLGGDR